MPLLTRLKETFRDEDLLGMFIGGGLLPDGRGGELSTDDD